MGRHGARGPDDARLKPQRAAGEFRDCRRSECHPWPDAVGDLSDPGVVRTVRRTDWSAPLDPSSFGGPARLWQRLCVRFNESHYIRIYDVSGRFRLGCEFISMLNERSAVARSLPELFHTGRPATLSPLGGKGNLPYFTPSHPETRRLCCLRGNGGHPSSSHEQ